MNSIWNKRKPGVFYCINKECELGQLDIGGSYKGGTCPACGQELQLYRGLNCNGEPLLGNPASYTTKLVIRPNGVAGKEKDGLPEERKEMVREFSDGHGDRS